MKRLLTIILAGMMLGSILLVSVPSQADVKFHLGFGAPYYYYPYPPSPYYYYYVDDDGDVRIRYRAAPGYFIVD